ncbi:MAG TPA: alkaline phosphatase family protein, partial [Verrucomicrobiae bacterium]|nr:alkaline phosphatase family protein [Verrucomicrobiae bacterium]
MSVTSGCFRRLRAVAFAVVAAALPGCGGIGHAPSASAVPAVTLEPAASANPISHIVLIVQENRSFDNMFAGSGVPGIDVVKSGLNHEGKSVALKPIPLAGYCSAAGCEDLDHVHTGFVEEYDGGKMDGFDLAHLGALGGGPSAGDFAYSYVRSSDIAPYIAMAKTYAIADHLFAS